MPEIQVLQSGDGAQRRPLLIGVTGGIGSGKSAVVEELVKHGAVAFSADRTVHELYSSNSAVQLAIRERWGDDVAPETMPVNKEKIAEIVFHDPHELRWLEALLHPLVAIEWERFVQEASSSSSPPRMIVAEVPLLFEAGLEGRYDVTIAVTAPESLRVHRAGLRGTGQSHLAKRMGQQLSDEERTERATLVVHNDGTVEELQQQIAQLVREELTA